MAGQLILGVHVNRISSVLPLDYTAEMYSKIGTAAQASKAGQASTTGAGGKSARSAKGYARYDDSPFTLAQAITRDTTELGLNAAQIFTHGPTSFRRAEFSEPDVRDAVDNLAVVIVHSSFLLTQVWKMKTKGRWLLKKIEKQLVACANIGAWGMVLHVDKQRPEDIAEVMAASKEAALRTGVVILLEMIAMREDPLSCETPAKMNNITDLIAARVRGGSVVLGSGEPDDSSELFGTFITQLPNDVTAAHDCHWWGWCIDTAHIWAAGVDIRSYNDVAKYLVAIKPGSVLCFHLNGSSVPLGDGHDIHQIVFSDGDLIWHGIEPRESGVRAVVEYAVARSLPIICEIARGDNSEVGLEAVKRLAGCKEATQE